MPSDTSGRGGCGWRSTSSASFALGAAERDLALLAKAHDVPLEKLPPTFEREVGVVTTDLVRILDAYNRLLSSYLDATVTSQVPPGLSRDLSEPRPASPALG